MYKLIQTVELDKSLTIKNVQRKSDGACIPFDPANTDYANFKREILADEAQLQDADGNIMTAEEAKAFVATLPA